MIRYCNFLLIFFAIFCFCYLFAGRGAAFIIYDISISYGILFGFIPYFIFSKYSNLKFITNSYSILLVIIVFLFVFYCFFSLSYSPSFNYGLDKILNLFLFFVVGILFFSLLNKNEFEIILRYLVYFIASLSIIYIFLNSMNGFQNRIGLLGAGSITTGRFFSFACILSMYFLISEKRIKYLFIFIFLLIAVFLSGSRGNFLFILLALIVPWIFNNFRVFLKSFTVFIILIYLGFEFSLYEKIPFVYRYTLLFEGGGDSISTRFDSFKMAIAIFENNFLFGVGIGGYSFHSLGYDGFDYPHNIFLEIGAELGFVGVFLFLLIISLSFILGRNNFIILSLLIFYVLVSSGSGDLYDARFIFIIFLFKFILRRS